MTRSIPVAGAAIAWSLLVLGPASPADAQRISLQELAAKVACVSAASDANDLYFEGCNVHVRDGSGVSNPLNPTGQGNLILGYNEGVGKTRTGAHNLVIGPEHAYSRSAGLLAGQGNTLDADSASVTGGTGNVASGWLSSVVGGSGNTASEYQSLALGGTGNTAAALYSVTVGGLNNTASGLNSVVAAGRNNNVTGGASIVVAGEYNDASGDVAAAVGGTSNDASGSHATVSGGFANVAAGNTSSIAGGAVNQTSGLYAAVSGGRYNLASGESSVVVGGGALPNQFSGRNEASQASSVVLGGAFNTASVPQAAIVGASSPAQLSGALACVHPSSDATSLVFEGCNVQIRDGSGSSYGTPPYSGVGNLILGYNESPVPVPDPADRAGKHNLVIGPYHHYTSAGGLVGGSLNVLSGTGPAIVTGFANQATGPYAIVVGSDSVISTGGDDLRFGGNVTVGTLTILGN